MPEWIPDLSSERVLTMTYVEGMHLGIFSIATLTKIALTTSDNCCGIFYMFRLNDASMHSTLIFIQVISSFAKMTDWE